MKCAESMPEQLCKNVRERRRGIAPASDRVRTNCQQFDGYAVPYSVVLSVSFSSM